MLHLGAVNEFSSLVGILRLRARRQPEFPIYTFLVDGEEEELTLTCGELDARASEIASRLAALGARPGDRSLLLHPPGLELISALFGCLYAGVVAVPAYPPRPTPRPGGDSRLRALARDAGPRFALTVSSILARVGAGTLPELDGVGWLATDDGSAEAPAGASRWSSVDLPEPRPDTPAILQYTSGSTTAPKGVIVTHGNLVENEEMIRRAFGQSERSVVVGWLPMYHDMGLIGNVLLPLFAGARAILMAPMVFLRKPRRWLQAIDRYRATTSGGPNFAYDLCVRKIPPAERRNLDLSSWSVAFNGAEPVRSSTLDRFADAFAPCGFHRRAFLACYGLAEATLLVAGGSPDRPPRVESVSAADLTEDRVVAAPRGRPGSRELVSCGRPAPGQRVEIVDPVLHRRCAAGRVGEIWVSGPSVGQGYWNRQEATESTFRARLAEDPEAGPFLSTGDLGFVVGGELFVTGRSKELLIVRGRNHYPQDVELTVERSHPALRPGCGAAFAVEVGEEEHLVVVHEVERHFRGSAAEVVESVRRAVSEEHEIAVGEVVLVAPGCVPKTTSGKIRRRACREDFLAGRLRGVAPRAPRAAVWERPEEPELDAADLRATPAAERPARLEAHLRRWAAGVLRIAAEAVEPHRPLSAYGLDSLQAVELCHVTGTRLAVELAPSRLLAGASLSELAAEVLAGLGEAPAEATVARVATVVRGRPPAEAVLSYGQRALWWLERMAPDSAAYNLVGVARVRGNLSRPALRRALRDLVERHPALRATFTERHGEPRQRFHAAVELDLDEVAEAPEGDSGDPLLEAAYRPFDLEDGPLLRVGLERDAGGGQRIALTVHHLVADFWSLAVLLDELAVRYASHRGEAVPPLVPLQLHYGEVVREQEKWLAGPRGEASWRYWRRRLVPEPAPIDLPLDRPRPPVKGYRGDSVGLALSAAASAELEALGRTREATLYMVLLAAFQALLGRYTGQTDFAVGSPAACRGSAALASLVGYLAGPLVMRAELDGDPTFDELLARVRRGALEAFEHQDFPLALLAERLRPDRDPGRSPFFQVMLVLQQPRRPAEQALAACALGRPGIRLLAGSLELESVSFRQRVSRFDLTLQTAKIEGRLHAVVQYDRELFDAVTARRFLAHFERLLTGLAAAPGRRLSALELLGAGERHQLVAEWNDTATPWPDVPLVHELLATRASSAPESVALVAEERAVSRGELERRAALLAGRLRELGAGPETRVAVALERCPEMVVAFLAILRAGACYVPLDPSLPEPRRAFVLADCGASLVVARGPLNGGAVGVGPCEGRRPQPDNAAYVIYTSGSTGRPKGVVASHRAIVNRLLWTQAASPLTPRDAVLQSAGSGFDFAVWEIFGSLLAGSRLVLAHPGRTHDPTYLWDLIVEQRVTVAHFVPPMLALFLEAGAKRGDGRDTVLRLVFSGGEALSRSLRDRFFEQLGAELWNQYGPTEATVDATFQPCRPEPFATRAVAIGRPIANLGARVLDARRRLLPAGARGELHLVGEGLARGYLDRPALTARRFLPDPFADRPGGRLYRTGDLARYRQGGELEFLGRGDLQVKVRGQRLELGEVEAFLAVHPSVREAAVAAWPEGAGEASAEGPRLVAYVVAEPRRPASPRELRSHLQRQLPGFMVPAEVVLIEALPRTPGGKLDRRSLPPPDRTHRELSQDFVAPRSPIEEGLADLWAELLDRERIGVRDDFFALGGHSLLGVRLVFRIREVFAVDLPPVAVFEAPTVERMALRVAAASGSAPPPLAPVPRRGPSVLSFAQERLWFLERWQPGTAAYNLPGVLRLRGALRVAVLEASLCEMIRRHESLRTTFRADGPQGRPVQVIAPARRRPLPLVDLSRTDAGRRESLASSVVGREAKRPFDLERGPLLRTAILRLDDELHLLWINLHHVVSDGGSVDVFLRELGSLYRALVAVRPSPLPEPEIQYADYAHHQRSWLSGDALEVELSWWRRQVADLPALALPTDRQPPAVRSWRGGRVTLLFGEDTTAALQGLCRERGTTLYMALLAGFFCLLYRLTHQRDLAVGSPVAQRHRAELEGVIGLFVNTLVLRADLAPPPGAGEPTFGDLLGRVREAVLAAYAHQDLPFEKLVEALRPDRGPGHNPLFRVMFALERVSRREEVLAPGLTWRRIDLASSTAKFDLTLALELGEGSLAGALEYSVDLLDRTTVRRLAGSLRCLLEGLAGAGERRLSELPLLRAAELQQVVVEWNDTRVVAENGDACLHWLVEGEVRRAPDAVALDFEGEQWSYGALDLRADDLARRLRQRGIGPEAVVGVCAERGDGLVAALLGVLKAGAAYLPFDPREPGKRLAGMLAQARARVVLAPPGWASEVAVPVLAPDEPGSTPRPLREPVPVTPTNAAYVIFTSGSTGEPKATVTTHGAVCRNLLSTRRLWPLSAADRLLVKTPGQFDVAVKEVFWPLASGARLVVARPDGHWDPAYLRALVERAAVTAVGFVPAMLEAFLGVLEPGACRSLRLVTCGSEALSPSLAKRCRQLLDAALLHFYGPTEAAIDVLAWKCDGRRGVVPLGRPLAGTRIYLAGPRLEPVPAGALGEVAIGGAAPARGYLGRPVASSERFVPEPYSGEPGARMYCTGDLARWWPDGTCHFQGRRDHQVKVRGHRIELGEIEAVLERHPGVEKAVVVLAAPVPSEDAGDRPLIAWVVPRAETPAAVAEIRDFAASRLPGPMVPRLALLDVLPLKAGGKVDRAALSHLPSPSSSAVSAAPGTPTETALAELWCELLGVEEVASGSDFFELGGHSLLAVRLVSRLRQLLAVEIPLREVFEAPRLAALARRIDEAARAPELSGVAPPRPWPRPAVLPLSFAQQRLWFLDRFDPMSPVYHVAGALRLAGRFERTLLEHGLAAVLARHEVLRTGFVAVEGRPIQVIADALALPMPEVDLSALAPPRRQSELQRLARREARRPFDLAAPPLLRLSLLRLAEAEHVLLTTFHHIIADAWSMDVLVRELEAHVTAFEVGVLPALPELPVQYADYALWQRDWLRGEVLASQVGWWREQLAGAAPVLRLPVDRPRPAVPRYRGGRVTLAPDPSSWSELRALGLRHGATSFMTVLAAFGIFLGRHAGQDRFAIGSPIAHRRWAELEELIGFFVNTLALVTDLGGDPTASEVLARTRAAALGAYGHQDLPFEKLVEELRPERDTGHSPVFQVLFVLGKAPPPLTLPGLTLSPIAVDTATAKFALSLLAEEAGSTTFEYDVDRFDETTIRRLGEHWRNLLRAFAAAPERAISTLAMLGPAERHQLSAEWNDTRAAGGDRDLCLTRMLRAPLEHLGEKIALTFGERHLGYGELHRRVRRLARRLEDLGAGPETPVGVLLERSPEMVVALLGILEAGAAYVPLDPSHPAARLDGMARDAGVRVLLSEACQRQALASYDGPVISVDGGADGNDPLPGGAGPDNLAYVIYTSGSTGRPNGVGISRRSLASLLRSMARRPGLGRHDVLLAVTTLSFDIAALELFLPLVAGARVALASREAAGDPRRLLGELETSRATHLQATPTTWQMLADGGFEAAPGLVALAGGEALSPDLARRLRSRTDALWNVYGPTEATIWATVQQIDGELRRISIGRPVDGTRIRLLGRRHERVPAGAVGELAIGGIGLARGYPGRPGLTAERFVPDDSDLAGARLYRTGDLARQRADGVLECLGRRDHQLKLRGFRLEPGEIEAALRSHPAVREALVRVWRTGTGDPRLAAYVAPREAPPPPEELRRFLATRLPSYMLPASFEVLEALPRTPNGKLDRRALPPPGPARPGPDELYVAPGTPLEEVLAGLWAELLGVDRVGVHDDFFALGGHSLLTVRMLSWVESYLGVEVPVRRFFEAPTVAALCDALLAEEGLETSVPSIVPRPDSETPELSYSQERLWFLDRFEPNSAVYNLFAAVDLTGPVDAGALERALGEVARRHEVLRTRLPAAEGKPTPVVSPADPFRLPLVDLEGSADAAARAGELACAAARRPIDLVNGPVWRAFLLRQARDRHVLLLSFHHIVADGVSMEVLIRELAALYEAFRAGRGSPLAPLPFQYADFARWQRGWLRGEVLERQLAYWREQLDGAPQALELPTDRPRPSRRRGRGRRLPLVLDRHFTEELRNLGHGHGATLFMALLAALQVLLHRTSGENDLLVGSPTANRRRPELEGLIGCFVNTLVLRTDLAALGGSGEARFGELLARVREVTLEAYSHQDLPFERLVEELHPVRDPSRAPLVQVLFAFQEAPRTELCLPGLTLGFQELDSRTAKFDLLLAMRAGESGLSGSLTLDSDLWSASTGARMVGHFRNLLAGIAADPEQRLSRLPLLAAPERHQLGVEWNDTGAAIAGDDLYRRFERQADRVAERVALVCGERQVSYRELGRQAHGLARELERRGVGPEARIGLCLERSVEMVSAFVGILESGAAWVPLEPSYPAERLRFMVEDARVSLVVTRSRLRDERRPARGDVRAPAAHSLAYVLYTSGSSGRPKATAISRASVANLADALASTVYRGSASPLRVGLNAPLAFDAAVKQVIQLFAGHTLVIVPETARRDPTELLACLVEKRVNVLDITPAQLRLALGAGLGEDTALERVLVGGEALDEATWERLARPGPIGFWNVYGPTECTVDATVCPITPGSSPSLGRPLGRVRLAVSGPRLAAVGIGVPGHLHVAGAGLARGYFGRPGATAASFIPDPAARRPGRRLYRTGDRACYLPDGRLRFLGRLDRQVKLAGHRIEPGEVEAALRRRPEVRDARVLVRRQGGEDQLTAYVVTEAGTPRTPGELRRQLAAELPAHMVPGAWVALEAFPLTPNGKVDERALPAPGQERPALATSYTAPRGPVEEMLAEVWSEVLERRPVGVHDDFFELGGHSLLATQVVSRIRRAFGVELPLRRLFESPTIADVAPHVRAAAGWSRSAPPIRPRDVRTEPVLSHAQERLWFLDQLSPGSAVYNVPGVVQLEGVLDPAVLAWCLDEIARRHEVLRARFEEIDGRPVQVIAPRLRLRLPVWDLSAVDGRLQERETARLVDREIRRPFRLSRGPLIRAALVRLGPRLHVAALTLHHIVSDAWSRAVLIREIAALYAAPREDALPPLAVQYADFAAWQRELLRGEVGETQLGYWRRQLKDAPRHLELPTDRPRPAHRRPEGATLGFRWPAALTARLRALARRHGASLFMTLLASLQSLLSRYTGQRDLSVGSVVANRHRLEIEELIGFFANTIVLRGDLSGDPAFGELLQRVRETALGAYAHQDLPFELLVEELEGGREAGRTPLFQVMFVLQNAPRTRLAIPGLEIRPFEVATATAKFDLTLILTEDEEGLSGTAELSAALFDRTTVARLLRHFETLTRDGAREPRQRLSQLRWWTDAERNQLLEEWSASRLGTPSEQGLEVLFDSRARSVPDAVALVCEGEGGRPDEHWSYRHLRRRAERLARHLRARGVGPEIRVAFYLERGPEAVVAVLATVIAGGAYVPLDPGDPTERLAFLVEDAQAAVLLTESRFRPRLPDTRAEVIDLDRISDEEAGGLVSAVSGADSERLAYVMYTSGSTGSPKGVGVSHRAVTRLVRDVGYVSLDAGQTFLLLAPLAFDASTFEIWAPLASGGRLVVFPPGAPSLEALGRGLERHRVTTLWLTAGLFHQMVDEPAAASLAGLDQLLAGGDALSQRHVRRARELLGAGRLINGYGPTEATTFACCYPVATPPRRDAPVPIGRPVDNTRIYLLDRHLRPVPAGVNGQLFIGGDGLARGYLGRPARTARSFLPDPFGGGGERLYETGDRARYLADGNVEFLGRLDRQVKVRGFRVEPGEVEAALVLHPAVREAAVTVRPGSKPDDRRLTAYLVADPEPAAAELRRFLRGKLAAYMAPAAFVFVDALPLTPRGKVDRGALEKSTRRGPAAEAPLLRPLRTPAEELTEEIWKDVLGGPEPGLDDDFFELGGHSLLATRLVSRLREAFGVEIALQQVFETPTVAGLAAAVDRAIGAGRAPQAPPLRRARRGHEGTELSFAQRRLWFLDRFESAARSSYLVSAALELAGVLGPAVLLGSLAGVVRRHEALRTRFVERDGKPLQVVAERLEMVMPRVDLGRLSVERAEAEARRLAGREALRPFDLGAAPLLRLTLLRLARHRHVALLTLHHIVSDAWSMDVLVRELEACYEALSAGREPELPELPIQYADFARWQGEWLRGEVLESQLAYWSAQLGARPEVLDVPTDRPRPPRRSYRGEVYPVLLTEELSAALRDLGRHRGATLFMTLLAAFEVLLGRFSGQDAFAVGVPVAGRRWRQVEDLIGFFVNTLALGADLSGDPPFGGLLRRVRSVALGAYAHQDLPFEKLVEALEPERDFSRSPLFQVLFALQNAPRSAARLPGLTLTPLEVESGTSKYELSLYVDEAGPGLRASFEHNTDLFDGTTIRRLAEQFRILLAAAAGDPDRRCSELPLESAAQRHQLLGEWNDTGPRRRPPLSAQEQLAHQPIESQARRTPEAIALRGPRRGGAAEWLSYRHLDRRAGRFARSLSALGVGPEVRVGIGSARSADMVVAMLGVLKAGGAYVPLDPDQPSARRAFLLSDSGVSVLLTDREDAAVQGIRVLAMSDTEEPRPEIAPRRPSADNLAYVTYTSGSTGRPKGVAVTHRGVVALLRWAARRFTSRELAGVLASTSIGFDLSVFEIFVPLARGGRVLLAESALGLERSGTVTLLNTVPAVMAALIRSGGLPAALRTVNLAGEPLSWELTEAVRRQAPAARILNLYGPTEDTVYSTWAVLPGDGQRSAPPPIGRPVDGTRAHLLDRFLRPVPAGARGEICLGGSGLARGYLDRPALTARSFVPHTLTSKPGRRLYRTGDLARHRVNGELEFLGRRDHQLKLRGFRIEPGEVEAVLASHPAVRECLALARKVAGDPRLVAYVGSSASDDGELRRFLEARLPRYMVPSAFELVEALPRTPSGKVDRAALPDPGSGSLAAAGGRPFVAPGTAAERDLAEIWCELLGVERVSVHDDFFARGGHSLLAVQLVSRIRTARGVELSLPIVFERSTLGELAAEVTRREARESLPAIAPDAESEGEWLLEHLDELSDEEVADLLEKMSAEPEEIEP